MDPITVGFWGPPRLILSDDAQKRLHRLMSRYLRPSRKVRFIVMASRSLREAIRLGLSEIPARL